MVANLEKNLANALNSEDMVKVRTMLESIDGNAMDAVVEALAEKGVEAMNVSTEKIDEVKALLAKEIKSRGALLDKYLDQGKAGLEAFDKESKELFNGTVAELKNLVSDEDLQKLKTRFNDTDKKIQQLFSATQ